jgi:hypothetical protein
VGGRDILMRLGRRWCSMGRWADCDGEALPRSGVRGEVEYDEDDELAVALEPGS